MTAYRPLSEADVSGKRVLVRVDFNVPMADGAVADDTRLRAALPTIQVLRDREAKIILAAHMGRPKGEWRPELSLKPAADVLAELVGAPVAFAGDCVGPVALEAVSALEPTEMVLLENTRFHAGDEANDPDFADGLAALADIYVNDAFSAAHRAHASTVGVAERLPAYAGEALARELDYLGQALGGEPNRPVLAVVGGAKVSTKITLLENLLAKVDALAVGGGMANTFLAARGLEVGASLNEPDFHDAARRIDAAAEAAGCRLILPADVVVAEKFEARAPHRVRPADQVRRGEMILDVGPESVDLLANAVDDCRTLIWNGPLGAFETPPFDTATMELAKYVAKRTHHADLISVAGGGDTVAALNQAGVADDLTFVSTAGGAFLEWMEGRELPGVAVLTQHTRD